MASSSRPSRKNARCGPPSRHDQHRCGLERRTARLIQAVNRLRHDGRELDLDAVSDELRAKAHRSCPCGAPPMNNCCGARTPLAFESRRSAPSARVNANTGSVRPNVRCISRAIIGRKTSSVAGGSVIDVMEHAELLDRDRDASARDAERRDERARAGRALRRSTRSARRSSTGSSARMPCRSVRYSTRHTPSCDSNRAERSRRAAQWRTPIRL